MANRRKKRKQEVEIKTAEKRKFPTRKALVLLAVTSVLFVIYQVMIKLEQIWIMHVYFISAGLILLLYIFINRGLFRIPKPEELSPEWSCERKDKFIAEQIVRRKRSAVPLYFFIGMAMTLIYDTVYLFLTLNMGMDL